MINQGHHRPPRVKQQAKSAIRVILANPRYTGRQVWNKQRKAEILIDVDDVALGHETKMRWNPAQEWIYSNDRAQEALIDDETFHQVQTMIAAGARRPDVNRKPRRSKRSYAFSGLLFCGLCDRRMIGSFNNGRNHYRCTYSAEYADANRLAHPRSLYLREDKITELVDPWVRRAFSSANLRTTLQAMADAQHSDGDQHRVIVAREKIAICDTKLDRYRAALDAGTDPVLVQQWITQVQAERAVAAADLRQITGRRSLTADEISTMVDAMSGIAQILRQADPADKAEVYQQLGIRLTYKPGPRLIQAEASPSGSCTKVCPEGELSPHYPHPYPKARVHASTVASWRADCPPGSLVQACLSLIVCRAVWVAVLDGHAGRCRVRGFLWAGTRVEYPARHDQSARVQSARSIR